MTYHPPGHIPHDPSNPYAPPETEIGYQAPRLPGLSPTRFEPGEVLSRTWRLYKDQMGLCVGVNFVGGLLAQAGQLVYRGLLETLQLTTKDPVVIVPTVIIGMIIVFIYSFWISLGVLLFNLRLAGGRKAGFSDLFAGGPYLLSFLLATVIYFLLACGVAAIGLLPVGLAWAVAGGSQEAVIGGVAVGVLVAFAVFIVLGIRLSQYQYLIVDNRASALDSLQLSMQITRGNALNLVLIWLVTIPINLLGILACCVGLLFTMPFTYLMMAVTYLAITGQPIAEPGLEIRFDADPQLKPLAPEDPLA